MTFAAGFAAWVAAAAVGHVGVLSHRQAVVSAPAPARATERPSTWELPIFRLGTAAGPLGWSTAIGDFNTDGTPDLAIADRVSGPAAGSSYRIEFSVSGRESKTVAFDSEQNALTVRVSDVDHDNDLDLVVSSALSREVVGVWLNDGSGGFAQSDASAFPTELQQIHSLDAADPSDAAAGVGLTPDRITAGLVAGKHWTPAQPRRSRFGVRSTRLQPAILSSALASRAPPAPASSFLNL